MVRHYSEYTCGHILVFFVQFSEGKSLGARVKGREGEFDRRLICHILAALSSLDNGELSWG